MVINTKKIAVFTSSLCLATALFWTSTAQAAEIRVNKGDTLWNLAKKYGTTVEKIKKLNHLKSDSILIGQTLQIDTKVAATKSRPKSVASRSSSRLDNLLDFAQSFEGARYRYGGENPDGFDCSGFVRYVYKTYGIELVHSSARQYATCGTEVAKSDLQPGDLVFFSINGKNVGHVGIYLGEDKFIHAANSRDGVMVSMLDNKYWAERYWGAKRVID
ncbi:NlpC/P60 family protein [Bacillota bacterium LX-D]|nr:NlpC/P60 family protein [Bacillota bacterium LX-D]